MCLKGTTLNCIKWWGANLGRTFCLLTICRNILQVNLAINDAKDDWQREYLMEMSINTTSAEASQGLLREVGTMY